MGRFDDVIMVVIFEIYLYFSSVHTLPIVHLKFQLKLTVFMHLWEREVKYLTSFLPSQNFHEKNEGIAKTLHHHDIGFS